MDKMKCLLSGVIIAVGAVNTILFFVWISLVKVEASNEEIPTYIYNNLTMQFTILELLLVITAFITAVLAIFGFQTIKSGAESKAIETVEEYLREEAPKLISKEIDKRTIINPQGSYSLDEAIQQKTTAAKESEDI